MRWTPNQFFNFSLPLTHCAIPTPTAPGDPLKIFLHSPHTRPYTLPTNPFGTTLDMSRHPFDTDTMPDWLAAAPLPSPVDQSVSAPSPNPIAPSTDHLLAYPNTKLLRDLRDAQFAIMFETTLDKMTQGVSLATILKEDMRGFNYTAFLRWIHADPTRKNRYHESQEIGAEVVAGEILEIADARGDAIPEDVQRSKLRIDSRRFLLGVWSKKRYGEIKQIDVTGGISITSALEQARSRMFGALREEIEEAVIVESATDTLPDYSTKPTFESDDDDE